MTSILPPLGLNLYRSDGVHPLHALPDPHPGDASPYRRPLPFQSPPRRARVLSPDPVLPAVVIGSRNTDENSVPTSPTSLTRPQQPSAVSSRFCTGDLSTLPQVSPSPRSPLFTSQAHNGVPRGKTGIPSRYRQVDSGRGDDSLQAEPLPAKRSYLAGQRIVDNPKEPVTLTRSQTPSTPQRGMHAEYTSGNSAPPRLSPAGARPQSTRHRLSDVSSAFVHSIKTASISNASMSIFPRSSRMAQSSDCPSLVRLPRYSTESDRTMPSGLPFDAPLARAVKRKLVIEELIATEESYIADLKALVYLYSTLLACATTLSNALRISIQRNVTNILHLHEKMADEMHHALYRAAARKWADTALPTRQQRPSAYTETRLSNDPTGGHALKVDLLNTRVAPPALQPSSGSAEPAEILDIAAIFEENLSALLMYEEYCANYEVVTHELQKQTSVTWSTYELGMESLVRTLTAVDQQTYQSRKGLTVSDLLIKPIQRICKYPLLLSDLLRHLPIIDGVGAHEAVNGVLNRLREVVWSVDVVTGSPFTRMQIQRRLRLQERLNLQAAGIPLNRFREFGHIQLCGVLHVAYQTKHTICGSYALCAVFDDHFMTAFPSRPEGMFDLFAVINLTDLQIRPADDGKGIQCHSALYTFKLCFVARGVLHEIILSACSPTEQNEWLSALSNSLKIPIRDGALASSFPTQCYSDLKPLGRAVTPEASLTPRSSIPQAANDADQPLIAQIIVRNTHNPQDLQDFRAPSTTHVHRAVSQGPEAKVVVLAPKRSERTRLETVLSDVWTKDRLPFPGMISNKSSQILRASAGSLVRKLSFASIQGSFSRRSASITVSSKKSSDGLSEGKSQYSARQTGSKNLSDRRNPRGRETNDIPELDTMDNVVGRMIGGSTFGSKRLSFSAAGHAAEKKAQVRRRASSYNVGPEDPAAVFYDNEDEVERVVQVVEGNDGTQLVGTKTSAESLRKESKRKRWSNPILKLKELGTEGLKTILHHSK